MIAHPEWVSVGARVEIVRRIGQSVVRRDKATVTRHTATTVDVETDLGSKAKFRAKWNGYHETPAYLRYITELKPLDQDNP